MAVLEELYQYTSLDVLVKIVTNKTLRMSDITKTNDSAEIIWATRHILKEFREAYGKAQDDGSLRFIARRISCEQLENQVEQNIRDWFSRYTFYCICMSEAKDQLSQWRGYADDGKGVAIGFNINALEQLCKDRSYTHKGQTIVAHELDFKKIVYDEKDQSELIYEFVNESIRHINESLQGSETIRLYPTELRDASNRMIGRDLMNKAVIIKNPSFEEEREHRIIFKCNNEDLGRKQWKPFERDETIEYMVRNNMLVSYIDLSLKPYIYDAENPLITSICTGPKCSVSSEDLKQLLKYNGIPVDKIVIDKSKSTYR